MILMRRAMCRVDSGAEWLRRAKAKNRLIAVISPVPKLLVSTLAFVARLIAEKTSRNENRCGMATARMTMPVSPSS